MTEYLIAALLWLSIVGSGLIAGIYFAFSTFVMTALGRLEQSAGMAVMNAVNTVILRSPFVPIFFGTTLTSAVLSVLGLIFWGEPGTMAMLAGGIIYVLGMFVVTVARNVPLNDALAALGPGSEEAAVVWVRYLREWTAWNHVRTIASSLAMILFVIALAAR